MSEKELDQGQMIYSLPRRTEKGRELEFESNYRDIGTLLCKYKYTQRDLRIFQGTFLNSVEI